MWRAVASFDPDQGAAPTWLTNAARMRMSDVIRRGLKTWTGHTGVRGVREVEVATSVERLQVDRPSFDVEHVLAAVAVEDAAWAYHHGEIAQALAALTPTEREYVVARFWGGMESAQLDLVFGRGSRQHWYRARPKLEAALAHLV